MTVGDPRVSVVIPTFGRDDVLVATIRQLLALAEDLEIIVVDQTQAHHASTKQQLEDWSGDRKIRWVKQAPPGTVMAMNRGLREAHGSIVIFLDDDISVDAGLITSHVQALERYPDAWAIAGRVIQPETRSQLKIVNRHRSRGTITCDLEFDFSSRLETWVQNVMAGNLSVRREKALAIGGFDENFIPPVSYRFETEFAKRIIAAGGKIRYEPSAVIHHLRAPRGGTRSIGSHLDSASPLHGVGDYYYALKLGRGWERFRYIIRRPLREVCTKFHLRHPWWMPVKFIGELRAFFMALNMFRTAKH